MRLTGSRRFVTIAGQVRTPHPEEGYFSCEETLKCKMKADLPRHKADSLYDSRLDDLFPREHAPRHGIRPFRVGVSPQVPMFVQDVVCDIAIAFDVL